MIQKQLDAIEKADLEALVDREVPEGRSIEYKEAMPGGKADERNEFVADVTSFANADGGDLIYGVREKRDSNGEKTGTPEELVGLKDFAADAEKLRLENFLRECVEPQVRVQMRVVGGFPNGSILIVRVAKSWTAPHMIKGSPRFYSRNSSGKQPLDVSEIRQAFLLSESLEERIRQFRDDRIARIVAGETPVPMMKGPKAVLHAIPVVAITKRARFDPKTLRSLGGHRPYTGGYATWPRFEGMVTYDVADREIGSSYCSTSFWNGSQEVIDGGLAAPFDSNSLLSSGYEREAIAFAKGQLEAIKTLGFDPPIFLLLTLVGVRGSRFQAARTPFPDDPRFRAIERDVLILPEALVEDLETPLPRLLKPAFDAVWNATGRDASPNYDEQGNWSNRQ